MKRLSILAMFLVGLLALTSVAAFAQSSDESLVVDYVEFNGDVVDQGGFTDRVERGDEITIKTRLIALEDVDNARVRYEVLGHDHVADDDQLSWTSKNLDMEGNETMSVKGDITVPLRMDQREFQVRVSVYVDGSSAYEEVYEVSVQGIDEDEAIQVKNVFMTPEGQIKAGRYLLVRTQLKNYGDQDYEDVVIKASVPALGVSASDVLDEVEEEKSETSEDLVLRIPECAEEGVYKVLIQAEYNDGDHVVSQEESIEVTASDVCSAASGESMQDKTTISLGATSATVNAGQTATYPVTLTNEGSESKAYTVTVNGVQDWASSRVDQASTVVLGAGDTQTLFVSVTPTETAAAGQHMFTVTVASGAEVLQQLQMNAVVAESTAAEGGSGATEALKIGLVVLVVLFVILLLIVGFNKLKGSDDDEDDESGQTYY